MNSLEEIFITFGINISEKDNITTLKNLKKEIKEILNLTSNEEDIKELKEGLQVLEEKIKELDLENQEVVIPSHLQKSFDYETEYLKLLDLEEKFKKISQQDDSKTLKEMENLYDQIEDQKELLKKKKHLKPKKLPKRNIKNNKLGKEDITEEVNKNFIKKNNKNEETVVSVQAIRNRTEKRIQEELLEEKLTNEDIISLIIKNYEDFYNEDFLNINEKQKELFFEGLEEYNEKTTEDFRKSENKEEHEKLKFNRYFKQKTSKEDIIKSYKQFKNLFKKKKDNRFVIVFKNFKPKLKFLKEICPNNNKLNEITRLENLLYMNNIGILNKIIYQNLKYIYAKNLEIDDVLQEANISLYLSIDKYIQKYVEDIENNTKVIKFTTFITPQIINSLSNNKMINQQIEAPERLEEYKRIFNKNINKFEQTYEKSIELANSKELEEFFPDKFDASVEKTKDILTYIYRKNYSLDEINLFEEPEPEKEDSKESKRTKRIIQETFYDKDEMFEKLSKEELSEQIKEWLEFGLNQREIAVITKLYGFEKDIGEMTIEEISKEMKVTRERVRQIESSAIKKLKNKKLSKKMEKYTNL